MYTGTGTQVLFLPFFKNLLINYGIYLAPNKPVLMLLYLKLCTCMPLKMACIRIALTSGKVNIVVFSV